ncbi:hypothetical protein RUM44_006523 [Polyplax serrata]|uniref:Uncharacterized protein n=1 Tax=Polyplax serrata TaxID=468196 RepID=A0ABR1AID6_POLSC
MASSPQYVLPYLTGIHLRACKDFCFRDFMASRVTESLFLLLGAQLYLPYLMYALLVDSMERSRAVPTPVELVNYTVEDQFERKDGIKGGFG